MSFTNTFTVALCFTKEGFFVFLKKDLIWESQFCLTEFLISILNFFP